MAFKVKITMVGFLGNTEKYPCHFQHQPGDEIIFDGEKFIGRMCSAVWSLVVPITYQVHVVGPRFKNPAFFHPFWYAPISVDDPSMKKYDGLGFRNVLETAVEPQYHMANMAPPNSFKWPPHPERTVASTPTVICGDLRTAAMFRIEAIDLADKGFHVPYYRREMVILHKVQSNPGIAQDKILDLFSKDENEGIYPAMREVLVQALNEELESLGYLEFSGGKVFVSKKGEAKLDEFKKSLSAEEREALKV
jgi:uncharacterized repeat protein (TIGR04076 family)